MKDLEWNPDVTLYIKNGYLHDSRYVAGAHPFDEKLIGPDAENADSPFWVSCPVCEEYRKSLPTGWKYVWEQIRSVRTHFRGRLW